MISHCSNNWCKFFKAVCDQQRQGILAIIKKHQPLNASQIIQKVKLSQPTVSHHLKILKEAGLIKTEKKGKEVFYTLNKDSISKCCSGFIKKFTS